MWSAMLRRRLRPLWFALPGHRNHRAGAGEAAADAQECGAGGGSVQGGEIATLRAEIADLRRRLEAAETLLRTLHGPEALGQRGEALTIGAPPVPVEPAAETPRSH